MLCSDVSSLRFVNFSLFLALLAGCPAPEPTGIGVLGHDSHDPASLTVEVLGTSEDGLDVPRDLGFNPAVPGELWVVNRGDQGVVTYSNFGGGDQEALYRRDPYAEHFMAEVSSISFASNGLFGTCQETRNTYNGLTSGDDFMGPTLWDSDPEIFAQTNNEAVIYLTDLFGTHVDLGSHIDMVHGSPLCTGIAWERENVYWVMDGCGGPHTTGSWPNIQLTPCNEQGDIVRYDFHNDHGPGYDDHGDGIIERYAVGVYGYVEDVPSHMVLDPLSGMLYVADTGNSRILAVDTRSGTPGANLFPPEPGNEHREMDDVTWSVVVDSDSAELEHPSGLELHDGMLFVGDNATGRITAFTLEGETVDWLDTGVEDGGLMGLAFDDEGRLLYVDAERDELVRVSVSQ